VIDVKRNREIAAARQRQTTCSSVHERFHRQLGRFNPECPLCQKCGKEAIESGTAPHISLAKHIQPKGGDRKADYRREHRKLQDAQ
jgi:hypothetical protein